MGAAEDASLTLVGGWIVGHFGAATELACGGPPASGPHRALWAGHTGDPLAEEPFPGLLDVSVTDVVAGLADLPQRRRPDQDGSGTSRAVVHR